MLVACWSPKGGTGKSLVAAGLAYRFAEQGHVTLLVDLDPQKADLATLLQAPHRPSVLDWPLVTGGALTIPDSALVELEGGPRFMPGPARLVEEGAVGRDLTEKLLVALDRRGGIAVVDLSSTLRDSTLTMLDRADLVLLLTTPDLLAVRAVHAFVREMHLLNLDARRFRLVINRAGTRSGMEPGDIEELLQMQVAGLLPSVPAVTLAVNGGTAAQALRTRNPFTRAVGALAAELAPAAPEAGRSRPGSSLLARLFQWGRPDPAVQEELAAEAPAPAVDNAAPPPSPRGVTPKRFHVRRRERGG